MNALRNLTLAAAFAAVIPSAHAGLIYPLTPSTRMVGEESVY